MIRFCTPAEVLQVARSFSIDSRRNTLSDDDVNIAIDQASDLIRLMLLPRYQIATIEADVPRGIKTLCQYKSAIILNMIHKFVSADETTGIIGRFKAIVNIWKQAIVNGTLLDNSDELVDSFQPPQTVLASTATSLKLIFEDNNERPRNRIDQRRQTRFDQGIC